MSQATKVDILNYVTNQVYIYGYSFILITGLFGNTLNMVMFMTKLKDSVCTLYLFVSEICNNTVLILYILPSIVQLTYGSNGTESWLPWCKLTNYVADGCILISNLMLCLASVDRYLCSSRLPSRRQWSSVKVAKVAIAGTILLSLILTIPDLIYWYIDSNNNICTVGATYWTYTSYFLVPVMFTIIPLITLSVAGCKTYQNLQTTIHPTAPPASHTLRQRADNQMAQMLIAQIAWFLFETVTFAIINLYTIITFYWEKNDIQLALQNLFTAIAFVIYNSLLCINFYIYYLYSAAYRAGVKRMFTIRRVNR